MDRESRPLAPARRARAQPVIAQAETEDPFEPRAIQPAGGTRVPGPAAAALVRRLAIYIRGDRVGLDLWRPTPTVPAGTRPSSPRASKLRSSLRPSASWASPLARATCWVVRRRGATSIGSTSNHSCRRTSTCSVGSSRPRRRRGRLCSPRRCRPGPCRARRSRPRRCGPWQSRPRRRHEKRSRSWPSERLAAGPEAQRRRSRGYGCSGPAAAPWPRRPQCCAGAVPWSATRTNGRRRRPNRLSSTPAAAAWSGWRTNARGNRPNRSEAGSAARWLGRLADQREEEQPESEPSGHLGRWLVRLADHEGGAGRPGHARGRRGAGRCRAVPGRPVCGGAQRRPGVDRTGGPPLT